MDWSAINWLNLSVLTASVFLSALIGSFIGRRHYALSAVLSAIVFAAIYIGWSGYLEQHLGEIVAAPQEAQQEPAADLPMENHTPSRTNADGEP